MNCVEKNKQVVNRRRERRNKEVKEGNRMISDEAYQRRSCRSRTTLATAVG